MSGQLIGRGYMTIVGLRDGDPASTYVLLPSVESVTKKLDGTLSVGEVYCSVYKVTGSAAYALSADHTLRYVRKPDGATDILEHANGVSGSITVLSDTESIEFELSDSSNVIDRVRIPILSDATDVNDELDLYRYLREAIANGDTQFKGGLMLSSLIRLGEWANADTANPTMAKVWSGMNGLYKNGRTIANWWGGDMVDLFDENNNKITPIPLNAAAALVRMNGTGYFAKGNIQWNDDGSGSVAGGNLRWDAAGNVIIGSGIQIGDGSGTDKTTLASILNFINNLTKLIVPVNEQKEEISWAHPDVADCYALKAKKGLYAMGFLSAHGLNADGGGGGAAYDRLDAWADYSTDREGWVLSALLGHDLHTRLEAIEGDYVKLSDLPSLTGYATESWVLGKNYLTAITKTMVENVLTGNITTHTHSQYLTQHQPLDYINIKDIRGEERLPSYFGDFRLSAWFNMNGTPAANWYSGIHMKGWHGAYASWELCATSATSLADKNLYFRVGIPDAWEPWQTILTSVNYPVILGNIYQPKGDYLGYFGWLSNPGYDITERGNYIGYCYAQATPNGGGPIVSFNANGYGFQFLTRGTNAANNLYFRSLGYPLDEQGPWQTVLTSENYASVLDSRYLQPSMLGSYYTKTEADNKFALASALGNYLPLAGGTMLNTNLVSNLNADLLDGVHKDAFNGAARYGTRELRQGGYYKIKIKDGGQWMLSFKIIAYQNYALKEIVITGYNYQHWYQPTAALVNSQADWHKADTVNVTFGYDSDYLWVAIPAEDYAGITVTDVANGFQQVTDVHNLFEITYENTLSGTVKTTLTASRHATIADNVASASRLQAVRLINGTAFDGTADVLTAKWGMARNITIGNTAKSVDGSGNVAWSLADIGALPLVGGTMTGPLSIPRIHIFGIDSSDAYFTSDSSKNVYVNVGAKSLMVWDGWTTCVRSSNALAGQVLLGDASHRWSNVFANTINVSSSALVANLNADLLDGYHETEFMRSRGMADSANNNDTLWSQIGIKAYSGVLPDGLTDDNAYNYGEVISFPYGAFTRFEIYANHHSSSTSGLYFRSGWNNGKEPWKRFATTDSNVASATKLADNATYTAWGRPFFANGKPQNVSGDMTGVGSITASGNISAGALYSAAGANTDVGLACRGSEYTMSFIIGAGNVNRGIFDNTNNQWWIFRDSSTNTYIQGGNVGFGTVNPAYKVDIVGTAKISEGLLIGGLLSANGGISTNAITATEIHLGPITLKYNATYGGLQVIGGGLYTDSYLSAHGPSPTTVDYEARIAALENKIAQLENQLSA